MAAKFSVGGESYSQWVRRVVAQRGDVRMIPLFDSSVPEPRDLLCERVARAFASPIDPRYVSAFAGGNPYVVDHLCRRYDVPRDHVLTTTGATSALALLYRSFVRPGTRILVETPGFGLFAELAEAQDTPVDVFARSHGDFAIDVDAIAAALTPATRLVVLSNLHNPSGALAPAASLEAIGRLAEARDLIVLVDEVYRDYADAGHRPPAAAALSPRMVSIGSLTKIYGLSTLRCGWIVADPAIVAPVRRLLDRTEFGISNLAHAAAALVFDDIAVFDEWSRTCVERARPVIERQFAAWRAEGLIAGEVPRFGCTAFPRLMNVADTASFADWLSARSGVIVAPGEYFGAPGHIRIGFARDPDELAAGLAALGDGLRDYALQRLAAV